MDQMTASAESAVKNVVGHPKKSPRVLGTIKESRGSVKNLYDALGLEIDWDDITAKQWRAALLEVEQVKNALAEGGSVTWEKGKPVLRGLAIAGATAIAGALITGKGSLGGDKTPEA
jgi:hypothetical protein